MRSRRIFLATVVISSLLATACLKDLAKTLGELQVLHDVLTRKFGDEVYVNVNEAEAHLVLNVSFINSALNDKPPEERAKRAQETANLVESSFKRSKDLDAIWVGFIQQKTRLVVFHHTQVLDYFGFDKNAKRLSAPESASGIGSYGVELRTAVTYLDNSDESDISVSGIQLTGVPGEKGLTVLPHFKVRGDANAQKSKPPMIVSLDFASYANQAEFEQTTPIAFIADGKPVLRTVGHFTGSNTQFCYLTVAYSDFRKMIGAKRLTIKLGDKEYPLTPSQFAAMQRMGEYVTN